MVYSFPTTKNSTSYKLLAGSSYYSTRRSGSVIGIVLHVTAGIQDLDIAGTDLSAEKTAAWAVNSGAKVSWHVGTDSDSIVPCLPSSYTGWHAAKYNSRTIGIEISNKDARWDNKPDQWVEKTIRNTAKAAAAYVKEFNLPLVISTKSQVDTAHNKGTKFGFTYHSYLSTIRSDPGKTFPWARFIAMVKEELQPLDKPGRFLTEDGIADSGTWKVIQKWVGVERDGYVGPQTIGGIQRVSGRPVTGKWTQADTDALAVKVSRPDIKGKPWSYAWSTKPTELTRAIEAYLNRAIRNGSFTA